MREITLVFFGILAGISYDINVCHLWILKAEDCVGTDFTHSSYFFRFLTTNITSVHLGLLEASLI